MTAPGPAPALVWLRHDLRLTDQAAFAAAASSGGPVIPVYVLDDESPGDWRLGGAARWWLHHSLATLAQELAQRGSRLVLRRGRASAVLAQLAEETRAAHVHALHHYEPWWRAEEAALAARIGAERLQLHDGNYLLPPGTLTTGAGRPYQIYGAFWRALEGRMPPPEPQPAPDRLLAPALWPASDDLADWNLLPTRPDWAKGFAVWTPGEVAAAAQLTAFGPRVGAYATQRNLPGEEGSSRLSPHLHWGELSPAAVWHALGRAEGDKFRKELAWRDFTQNVILQFPEYGDRPHIRDFDRFPWRDHAGEAREDLARWQEGRTGYPIVDAGMRELWAIGWMHNRVRMIAASFLVKHLLIDWRVGARWFWDTLIDADYGNNSYNWQWIAGSGSGANPFTRIMAPLLQSAKFDAAPYIRRWVPELGALSDEAIHDPAGAEMDTPGYPAPIIGHRAARARALAAFRRFRGGEE